MTETAEDIHTLRSDLRRRQLVDLLKVAEQMLDAAADHDWDRVSMLEQERCGKLNACFSIPVDDLDSPTIVEAIAALLHMNEQVMSVVSLEREKALTSIRHADQSKLAINSYTKTAVLE